MKLNETEKKRNEKYRYKKIRTYIMCKESKQDKKKKNMKKESYRSHTYE